MAKTDATLKLEQQIYTTTHKMGVFSCYEVTIGWYGKERVDYMTYDTKGIFRCYEIKVSKSDFNSKAKLSFVGHYNYYVLTPELYEEVKDNIPNHIGVYIGTKYRDCELIKRAKKQELSVDDQILKDSFIRSLSRYFDESVKNSDGNYVKKLNKEIKDLTKERDSYYREFNDMKNLLYDKFGVKYKEIIKTMKDLYD